MAIRRLALVLLAVGLLLSGALTPIPDAGAVGVWTPVAPMGTTRYGHTATLLPDGQVLVVGGVSFSPDGAQFLASAERYDPVSGRWTPVAPMGAARANHTATLLPDGRVFIADGAPSGRAEIYDPAADRWTPAGVKSINLNHTVTLLPDGQILSTGGTVFSTAVERYDPATNRWTPVTPMATPRTGGQSATPLRDGRVLVAGGNVVVPGGTRLPNTAATAATEIYDPATDTWTAAAAMTTPRSGHQALALADGQVLVIGADDGDNLTAERYDPETDRWTPAAPLTARRSAYTATLLPDGQVLAVGGQTPRSAAVDAPGTMTERYDPATDRWTPAAPLSRGRAAHAATLLQDGRLFIAGGIAPDPATAGDISTVATAEVYADDSTLPGACFAETGHCIRGPFLAYWRAHGLDLGDAGVSYRESLALFGYPLSDVRVEALEDGRAYQVQYFERVRLEYHPEHAAPYDVLLGQFGRRVRPADPPAESIVGQVYFAETGHNLGDGFLDYWRANGGLARFGFPISEVVEQELDGRRYRVQYFERARFEYHPDNATPYDVLLGQFGRQILAEVDAGR